MCASETPGYFCAIQSSIVRSGDCSKWKPVIFGKLGESAASPSSVVSGRGNSSRASATDPSSLWIGIRLRAKRPSFCACAVRCWLVSPSWSHSRRDQPSTDAIRSAERPCGTCGCCPSTCALVAWEPSVPLPARRPHGVDDPGLSLHRRFSRLRRTRILTQEPYRGGSARGLGLDPFAWRASAVAVPGAAHRLHRARLGAELLAQRSDHDIHDV